MPHGGCLAFLVSIVWLLHCRFVGKKFIYFFFWINKLECLSQFVPSKYFHPSLLFVNHAVAYPNGTL
jgi:hypothetical protein